MKYLLDTHVLLWWSENNRRLKQNHREIIADDRNIIFVSVASVWEILIKTKTKKVRLRTAIEKIIEKYRFQVLDINLEHVLEIKKLASYHKDPFDRILIAQAMIENCVLLTTDKKIKKYKVSTL